MKNKYDVILETMNGLQPEKRQEYLLQQIALIQPQVMLEDLLKPDVRNAALFNAVTTLLKHHKMEFDPVAAARQDHPVGALAHGLPPADWDDDTVGGAIH